MTKNNSISITSNMRVAFYDVDSYRVVWHGAYPKYFEIARGELLEKIGYTYADMEQNQFFFPVIDMQIKYIDSLFDGQYFCVETSLVEWENKLIIDYLIYDRDSGQRITKAQTTQVAVKMPEKIMQYTAPQCLLKAIESALN